MRRRAYACVCLRIHHFCERSGDYGGKLGVRVAQNKKKRKHKNCIDLLLVKFVYVPFVKKVVPCVCFYSHLSETLHPNHLFETSYLNHLSGTSHPNHLSETSYPNHLSETSCHNFSVYVYRFTCEICKKKKKREKERNNLQRKYVNS